MVLSFKRIFSNNKIELQAKRLNKNINTITIRT